MLFPLDAKTLFMHGIFCFSQSRSLSSRIRMILSRVMFRTDYYFSAIFVYGFRLFLFIANHYFYVIRFMITLWLCVKVRTFVPSENVTRKRNTCLLLCIWYDFTGSIFDLAIYLFIILIVLGCSELMHRIVFYPFEWWAFKRCMLNFTF